MLLLLVKQVNNTDTSGCSMLMIACENKHPELVRELIQNYGADVMQTDADRTTALHVAVARFVPGLTLWGKGHC